MPATVATASVEDFCAVLLSWVRARGGGAPDSFDPGTLSAAEDARLDAFWAYGTEKCTLYSEDE